MSAPPRRWRHAAGILAATLAGMLALGACSVTTRDGAPTGGGDELQGPGAVEAPGAPDERPPGEDSGGAPIQVEVQERSLVYTGSMSVRVEDVVAAANRATDIAIGSGGLVGSDRRTLNAEDSQAHLVFRVPADKFTTVLDELAKLGEEETRAIGAQDVTEALVDLDARLATQEASVARVRALLARANTIAEIVSIESELTRRSAELDSLKQRRERLAGLVALSTITLNLLGPEVAGPHETETGFLAGLKDGWAAFLESVQIILTVAGWVLPWLIALGVPIWLLIWLLRRRRPRPVAPGAASTPSGPVPN